MVHTVYVMEMGVAQILLKTHVLFLGVKGRNVESFVQCIISYCVKCSLAPREKVGWSWNDCSGKILTRIIFID